MSDNDSERSSSPQHRSSTSRISRERWRLLALAVLKQKEDDAQDATIHTRTSVRRFTTFGTYRLDENSASVTCHFELGTSSFRANLLLASSVTSIADLAGFNNTGNVCIWPSEEILAYYCLKHKSLFDAAKICELGGGMTCLAGLFLALYSSAQHVYLTDGNERSIANVERTLAINERRVSTEASQLVWGERTELFNEIDCIICADCFFFDDGRRPLLDTIKSLLRRRVTPIRKEPDARHLPQLIAFAPARNGTLHAFADMARAEGFCVRISADYDERVRRIHEQLLVESAEESGVYDADLHFPLMLTMDGLY